VPAGEFAARARLQITLESDSGFNSPRLEFGGVRDLARVVGGEALCEIRCHADVVALGRNLAFEDVDIVKHG